MTTPTKLSEFLQIASLQSDGTATRRGTIVFVSLNRGLDRMIQQALSLGPHHRGHPSPWSHVFLLAQDYSGPDTIIVESSIRTRDGCLVWDEDHALDLFDVLTNNAQSGVLRGTVGDYDDFRVANAGVKWLPELTGADLSRIVALLTGHDWSDVRYDIPGLFRALLRLWSRNEVTLPPNPNLLYCSAFVQRIYRMALGKAGSFTASVADEDTTPDDIWYSSTGQALGPVTVNPGAALAGTVFLP